MPSSCEKGGINRDGRTYLFVMRFNGADMRLATLENLRAERVQIVTLGRLMLCWLDVEQSLADSRRTAGALHRSLDLAIVVSPVRPTRFPIRAYLGFGMKLH